MIDKSILSKIELQALDRLETVIDPELGIDLVNLGLIYDLKADSSHLIITMTFTTVACPMMDLILDNVHKEVLKVSEIETTEINIVWTPAWNPSMMSRYARLALGFSS